MNISVIGKSNFYSDGKISPMSSNSNSNSYDVQVLTRWHQAGSIIALVGGIGLGALLLLFGMLNGWNFIVSFIAMLACMAAVPLSVSWAYHASDRVRVLAEGLQFEYRGMLPFSVDFQAEVTH